MSDTSTGGATETTLAASSTAGIPPSQSDNSTATAQNPDSRSLNGSDGGSATISDATIDDRRESTEDAATSGTTGTTGTADPDDLESDPDLAEEIAGKPKLYDRFKEKNEQAKAEKARADAAEAKARELEEKWAQQADPVLQRITALPEVKRYLDANIPLAEALQRADADVEAAREAAEHQRMIQEADAANAQVIAQWDAYIKDAPDLDTALTRQAEFLESLKPVLAENAQAKPVVQAVRQNMAQLQLDATVEAIAKDHPGSDKNDIRRLVVSGDIPAAVLTASRQSLAAANRDREAEIARREAAAAEKAASAAIARYNASAAVRSDTPTPAVAANGAPGAPPTGLLSTMPQGDPNDPVYRAKFDKWMSERGRETTNTRGY